MRIMQRKASNKLGIQANRLKLEKTPSTKKSSIQNYDEMLLGTDLNPEKMKKKTRSITMSELEGSLKPLPKGEKTPPQPGKQPSRGLLPSPSKTSGLKKPTPLKSSYASPNYLKSTISFEARKEQGKARILSSKTLQRVSNCFNKSSSLKKISTLTKAPSFKHTRLDGNKCSKVLFCDNLDVQRATCSSTLKDSKFPPYLMLNPGATEAEGTSAKKVCRYNYCSLNGHHHNSVPSLKCFLSSKRRLLKTQRVVREEFPSPKVKFLQKEVQGVDYEPEVDQKHDFFVEVYVANKENTHSEIYPKDGLDPSEGNSSVDDPQTPQLIKVDDSSSVSTAEFMGEDSDMEWEEGHLCTERLEHQSEILISEHGVDKNDQEGPDLKSDETVNENLEFVVDKQLLPYPHEEILAWLYFSDVSFKPDSETNQPAESQNENPYMINEGDGTDSSIEDDAAISNEELEFDLIVEQSSLPSNDLTDETAEVGIEEFYSYMYLDDENHGNEANIENETVEDIGENKPEELVMESSANFPQDSKDVEDHSPVEQLVVNNYQAQSEGNEANKVDEEEDYPTTFKLPSYGDYVTEIEAPEMEDINETTEVDGFPVEENKTFTRQMKKESYCRKRTDTREELLVNCLKLKKSMRQAEEDEEREDREFNPSAPNFLPVEPDPEVERVDLRHQEMDERRNYEEWMLDYALQKTVNKLDPSRKRKVALLVQAFESVLPIPKCEPRLRRASSGFAHSRSIQACS